jgi:HEAT repeat protein
MSRKTKNTTSARKHSAVPPKAVAPVAPVIKAVEPAATAEKPVVETKTAAFAVIEPMLAGLRHIDADVAREAATELGKSGNPAAVAPLIDVVENANGYFHSVVRSAAAVSLALLKDSRAVDSLIEMVNDPITDPSTEAIHALAALGDRKAVARLIEVTRNTNNYYAGSVRRAAVAGLIKLGGDAAVTELRRLTATATEDAAIRELAGSNAKPAAV